MFQNVTITKKELADNPLGGNMRLHGFILILVGS